jgi:hypothetical protein
MANTRGTDYGRGLRLRPVFLGSSGLRTRMMRRASSVMRSIGVFSSGVGGTVGLALDRLAMSLTLLF